MPQIRCPKCGQLYDIPGVVAVRLPNSIATCHCGEWLSGSKAAVLARLVDVYAKRPQVQERLTTQVADALMRILEARGVIVVIEAEHLCMTMRGVKKAGTLTITSAVRGLFKDNPATRAEAMSLITHPGNRL